MGINSPSSFWGDVFAYAEWAMISLFEVSLVLFLATALIRIWRLKREKRQRSAAIMESGEAP